MEAKFCGKMKRPRLPQKADGIANPLERLVMCLLYVNNYLLI